MSNKAYVNDENKIVRVELIADTVTPTIITQSKVILQNVYFNTALTTSTYVKLYDMSSLPDENDTPLVTIKMPSVNSAGFPFTNLNTRNQNCGIFFENGMAFRATANAADNDTASPTNALSGIRWVYIIYKEV